MGGEGTSGYHEDHHNYDDDAMVMLIMMTSFIALCLSMYYWLPWAHEENQEKIQ